MGRDKSFSEFYDYNPDTGDYERRRSLGEKLRLALGSSVDSLRLLLPKKEKLDVSYFSWDEDYSSGRISKVGVSKGASVGRVLLTGSVIAGMAYGWFNRNNVVNATRGLITRVEAYYSDTNPVETVEPSQTIESKPTDVEPVSTPTPEPTEDPFKIYSSYEESGVVINFDKNNFPVSYSVDGKVIDIDRAELLKTIETAKKDNLPQLIIAVNSPEKDPETDEADFNPTFDRPAVAELPSDTLTEEQLLERGITIIQGKDVKLHLRASAFEPGSALDTFTVGGGNKMTIVLVDGPTVSGAYLNDPKYDSVIDSVGRYDADIEKYRQEQIDFWKQTELAAVELLRETQQTGGKFAEMIDLYQEDILYTQIRQSELAEATPESLVVDAGMSEYAGLYDPSSRTIFVAVGKTTEDLNPKKIIVYVNIDGKIVISNSQTMTFPVDYVPNETQNYPRPGDFNYRTENGEPEPTEYPGRVEYKSETEVWENDSRFNPENPMWYPYGGQMPSQVLRHEIKHDEKIVAHPSFDYMRDRGEWWTDMEAMGDIDKAFRLFEESGYKDNSLYWAIFEVDGLYIIGQTPTLEKI